MDVNEIINNQSLSVEQKISALKDKTIIVPTWGELQKEYNPLQHPVMTDITYVDKAKGGKVEKMSRIVLGWQKLAVKRMSALLCGIPVKRIYKPTNDQEKQASSILEDILKRNRINAVNLERARYLYASCENVTIWYAQEQPTQYGGMASKIKLRCKNYSPFNGDELYPLFDEYDDLVALSVQYHRQEGSKKVTYFDTYTDKKHICWRINDGAEILNENITIGKIAGVYIHRDEPIWEQMSQNVYEAEWTYSRNGNYIRKNCRPTLAIYTDDKMTMGNAPKGDNVGRDVIRLKKGDKAEYVTWNAANDVVKFHVEELKHNFNSQLQLPDMSMDNMKSSPMSGESRKMLFMDAQMKVTDESGIWLEYYDREINILRAFCKLMYPGLAGAFESLIIENLITPYQIKDESERIKNLADGAQKPIMSQLTAIRRLGYVEDAEAEQQQIKKEEENDLFDTAI